MIEITEIDRSAFGSIWPIMEPTVRAGETYALPIDMDELAAAEYWFATGHRVYGARRDGVWLGTYFLCRNQAGGGDHVANCGFMTHPRARGTGIGRAMASHALQTAAAAGFRAMQFNFVVSSNESAVRLWKATGFEVVGVLPGAFRHPARGFVDVFVMYRKL